MKRNTPIKNIFSQKKYLKGNNMKITIIYDNTSFTRDLKSDWGFAALVEFKEHKILFDTGSNGEILLNNMTKLKIDPDEICEIFLSHNHYDHTGGLSAFLNQNNDVIVYAPPSLRGIKNVKKLEYVNQPKELSPGIFSTGELENIEQSLAIQTEKGLVVIVGCSHPGVTTILKVANNFGTLQALIGGLHGFQEYDVFEPLELVCPTHCTQHIKEIKDRYPDKYIQGGAGKIINID